MTTQHTKEEQVKSALNVVMAIAEAIRELREVPSGELYARLMDKLSLEQYERIIDTLKRSGAITEQNHVLKWAV